MSKKNDLIKKIKTDLPAAAVVFFVALPLCLGIALASGTPLITGIISGVIGGIVVGLASGSSLGVSGPAAGMTVIVVSAIATLGGSWESFLLATIIAGIFQLIAGFAKAGTLAWFFPSSVITGMLTAIGLILIFKQIPHALGYDADYEGDLSFTQADHQNSFSEIRNAMEYFTGGAVLIAVISMAILILWEVWVSKKFPSLTFIPGPLVTVVVGIFINYLFQTGVIPLNLKEEHLVSIPSSGISNLFSSLSFPDFTQLTNAKVYLIALLIAAVASLETLLSVEAIDRLDPEKRKTPVNRELKAQGLGNIVSGLIGGLPLTQVIVRSSVNASFGGKTKMSTIMHGVLLLLTVVTIPSLLNMIPLASLACILLMVGYKLTKPAVFVQMYKHGWEQFVPFVVTVASVLFTDLLTGVGIGLAVSILFLLWYKVNNPFSLIRNELAGEGHFQITLPEEVSFLNKGSIRQMLDKVPPNSKVVINGAKSRSVHHDVNEIIRDFQVAAPAKSIAVEIIGQQINQELEGDLKTMKMYRKQLQGSITPQNAIELLKEGNKRFANNLKMHRDLLQQVNETSDGQFPFAAILSCIDSRTSAELIFDLGLGDVFSIRVAGIVLNDDILGSMEYACTVAGAKLIVVLGHSNCGAVRSALDNAGTGHIRSMLDKLSPAIDQAIGHANVKPGHNTAQEEKVTSVHVNLTMKNIVKRSNVLLDRVKKGELIIIGGTHDLSTGIVTFFDQDMISEHKYQNLATRFSDM